MLSVPITTALSQLFTDVSITSLVDADGKPLAYVNATGKWSPASITGTGSFVKSDSPTLITPALGTPASGILTDCTGLTESGQTLEDVTTLDVSTTKHGYAPKLPNDSSKYLNGVGGYSTITVPTAANPTGTIGLTAVNGAADTFLRSDSSPALSQAIAPNMTAAWIFSVAGAASTPAIKASGVPFAGTGTTSFPLVYINDANATASTTLNTVGTYLGVNGHGTADLMNLMVDGVQRHKVESTGLTTITVTGTPVLRLVYDNAFISSWTITASSYTGVRGLAFSGGGSVGGETVTSLSFAAYGSIGAVCIGPYSSQTASLYIPSNGGGNCNLKIRVGSTYTVSPIILQTNAGLSLGSIGGGGVHDIITTVSTTSTDGTFDTLDTYTLPAKGFNLGGDALEDWVTIKIVGHPSSAAEVKFVFAGVEWFDSGSIVRTSDTLIIAERKIVRTSSTTCKCVASWTENGQVSLVKEYDLTSRDFTTTNTNIIKAAATGTDAAAGDISVTVGKQRIEGMGS